MARVKKKHGIKGVARREKCHGCGKLIDLDAEPFNIFLDGRLTHPSEACSKVKELPNYDEL